MIRKILLPLLVVAGFGLMGCQEYGKVEQGRTVAFDKAAKVVTVVTDISADSSKPDYTGPIHTFALPVDPAETGADPKVGQCVSLDTDAKTVVMYNAKENKVEKISFEIIDQQKGIDLKKKHPLVFDAATDKPREFPQVQADKQTVTMYVQKQQLLITFKVSADDFDRFTAADWAFGDEVRMYYKDPQQALRFMNITKTDIFKR